MNSSLPEGSTPDEPASSKPWSCRRDGFCLLVFCGETLDDPSHPYSGKTPPCIQVAGFLGVVALVVTVGFYLRNIGLFFRVASTPDFKLSEADRVTLYGFIGLVMFWSIVPPVFFWVEYFWVWMRCPQRGSEDALKRGQDLSAKIWAAVLAVQVAALAVLL